MTLDPPEWVSQPDAAGKLQIAVFRVGFLLAHEHLQAAVTAWDEPGASAASLDEELRWRREAPIFKRLLRPLRDAVRWV